MLIDDLKQALRRIDDFSICENPLIEGILSSTKRDLNTPSLICIDAASLVSYISELIYKDPGETFDGVVVNTCFDLRMPSEHTWIEWAEKCGRFGSLITCLPIANGESAKVAYLFDMEMLGDVPVENLDFFVSVRQFEGHDKGVSYLPWILYFCLDADGSPVVGTETFKCIQTDPDWLLKMRPEFEDKESALESACQHAAAMLAFSLIPCSLLNVKNVQLSLRPVDQKLQKKRIKNGKLPLVKMHTLGIVVPGKRSVDGDGSQTLGNGASTRPLHLVRGHPADYRDGKGLFGKHKGIFWMSAHMRGNIDNGVIKKRYKISYKEDAEKPIAGDKRKS